MSIDMSAALSRDRLDDKGSAAARRAWIATALTIMGATAAVLLASFVAVISGLA